jgi:hypothetical protein
MMEIVILIAIMILILMAKKVGFHFSVIGFLFSKSVLFFLGWPKKISKILFALP